MALEQILRRCLPAVVLVLLATAAYFQARGATQLLALALGGGTATNDNDARRRKTHAARDETKTGRAILERNAFDSVTGPLGGAPAGPGLATKPHTDSSDPLSWPTCEGVQVLIVTESTDPWWSLTTLQAPGEARPRLRRVGDGVAGKQVAFIGYNPRQQAPAVWLEGRDAFCQCTLFRRQAAPAPVAAPPSADFNVERSLIEKGLADPPSVMGPVRMVPERRDGKLVGLRLFGIRPGSLPGVLGLQNGDRLDSINGFNVASPAQALEAYARLRAASQLSVRLERVGRPVELKLNIN